MATFDERSEQTAATESPEQSGPQLVTVCMADVAIKPVSWLWPGRIARGKVTLSAGHPGVGKSHQTMDMAARISTGSLWPDGTLCACGDVLLFSAEDDAGDTLRPRLEAAGADLQRVHVVRAVADEYLGNGIRPERVFCLERDLPALEAKLAELSSVSLIVIDPITAFLGHADDHRNGEVRGLLAPLADLAARYEAAIVAITHLNKGTANGAAVLLRIIGSIAFAGAARAAFLVARDPQDPNRRLFVPMKNNLGPDQGGLAFRIEGATIDSAAGPIETTRIIWEADPISTSAEDALMPETQGSTTLKSAVIWLRAALADGPVRSQELYNKAKSAGYSYSTLRRALGELKAITTQTGFHGGWTWSLPEGDTHVHETLS